jgi:hypothetical protein
MRAEHVCLVAIAALSSLVAQAAQLAALPPPTGIGIERGVVLVRCRAPTDGVFWFSRATVLDAGAPPDGADVLLTTAHGLPADPADVERDCIVLVRGKEQAISAVWHSGGNLVSEEHDWAVVLTRRVTGEIHRWRPAHATDEWLIEAAARRAPVRLVLRYADGPQSDCHLEPKTADPRLLLAHSCVSYPGTSGSPLVVAIEREPSPVLIGIHLGTQLTWTGTELDFVSVARPLDAAIAAAIEAAADRAAVPESRKRRRR